MKYVLDMHTHTIASGHAYSTINEMAQEASNRGLELLGITEHAPTMPGTCHLFYFQNLKVVPRKLFGIDIMFGVELNILDIKGRVDLDDFLLDQLDIKIASMHDPCFPSKSREENTQALINAIKNPRINIIGHPDDGRFPLDYLAIVQAAKEYGTLLEVNNSSMNPKGFRQNARENAKEYLKLCMNYEVPIILGSDSHHCSYIGNFDFAQPLLDEINFPTHLIANTSTAFLHTMIEHKKNALL